MYIGSGFATITLMRKPNNGGLTVDDSNTPSNTMWNRISTLEARLHRYQTMMGISVVGYLIMVTAIFYLTNGLVRKEMAISKLTTQRIELETAAGQSVGHIEADPNGDALISLGHSTGRYLALRVDQKNGARLTLGNQQLTLGLNVDDESISLLADAGDSGNSVFLNLSRDPESDRLKAAVATAGEVYVEPQIVELGDRPPWDDE